MTPDPPELVTPDPPSPRVSWVGSGHETIPVDGDTGYAQRVQSRDKTILDSTSQETVHCHWSVYMFGTLSISWSHMATPRSARKGRGSGNFFYSSLLQHCRTNHSAVFYHMSAVITNFNRKLQGVKQL